MFVKLHKSYRIVVAVCDNKLLGKKFVEGVKQLDVRDNFYNKQEMSYNEVVKLMKFQASEDAIFNIVGDESVKAAQEAGIINEDGIGYIDNIPFALVLL